MRIFIICLLTLLSLAAAASVPDTTFARLTVTFPAQKGHPAAVQIPYRKAGNLILLEASIDSLHGNFILDTGAPGLVLNRTYFRAYIREEYASAAGGITGQTMTTSTALIEGLRLQGISYELQTADVIPLGHIENSRRVKILGLLGNAVFAGKELVIDDRNEVLYLFPLNGRGQRISPDSLPAWSVSATLPLMAYQGVWIVQARVGSAKLRFCVDTGAEHTVLDNRLPGKVLEQVTITGRKTLRGTGSQPAEALEGLLASLRLGDIRLEKTPVIITSLAEMSNSYGLRIDGMLGYPFFAGRVTGINFVTGYLSVLTPI